MKKSNPEIKRSNDIKRFYYTYTLPKGTKRFKKTGYGVSWKDCLDGIKQNHPRRANIRQITARSYFGTQGNPVSTRNMLTRVVPPGASRVKDYYVGFKHDRRYYQIIVRADTFKRVEEWVKKNYPGAVSVKEVKLPFFFGPLGINYAK